MTARRSHPMPGGPARWAATLFALAATAAYAQPDPAPVIDQVVLVLADGSASDRERQDAADRLVAQADDPAAFKALDDHLAQPLAGAGAGRYILASLRSRTEASPRLFPPIAQRLAHASHEELPRFLEALPTFRTRDAARLLLVYTDPRWSEEVQAAAYSGLERLSGRDDLGRDRSAWSAWMLEADQSTESQWRHRLATSLAAQADRLSAQARAARARMLDAYRQLHLATPVEKRSELLAHLVGDPDPAVRDLGFELASRELASGTVLGPDVAEAVLSRLASPEGPVRASAANLVRQLAPPDAAPRVLAALAAEESPAVAAPLLRAASRWPKPDMAPIALLWLDQPGPDRAAAASALLALVRAGELIPPAQARALASLRSMADAELTAQAISLLGALGDSADDARLISLLSTAAQPLRATLCETLVYVHEAMDPILAAATQDPDLFEVASRAVLLHDPTADGFRRLLTLKPPAGEVARPALLRLARALSSADLWAICGQTRDPSLLRDLLEVLTSDEREMARSVDPAEREALAAGVMAYSDLQLRGGEADAALATIESSPFVAGGTADPPHDPPPGLPARRVTALVALNRLEQAAAVPGVGVDAWIDGLAFAARRPYARGIADAIEDRFASTITPQQKEVLRAMRESLAAKPGDDDSR